MIKKFKDLIPPGKSLSGWAVEHRIVPQTLRTMIGRKNHAKLIERRASELGVDLSTFKRVMRNEYIFAWIVTNDVSMDEIKEALNLD